MNYIDDFFFLILYNQSQSYDSKFMSNLKKTQLERDEHLNKIINIKNLLIIIIINIIIIITIITIIIIIILQVKCTEYFGGD